jgi:hypothetical protein
MKINTRDVFRTEQVVMPLLEEWSNVHDPRRFRYEEAEAELHRLTRGGMLHSAEEEDLKNEAWERLTLGVVRRSIESCFNDSDVRVRTGSHTVRSGMMTGHFRVLFGDAKSSVVLKGLQALSENKSLRVEQTWPEIQVKWRGRA